MCGEEWSLVCGTATLSKGGQFPLPRKVNIGMVGMQTVCGEKSVERINNF